jgi:hypothetical protein
MAVVVPPPPAGGATTRTRCSLMTLSRPGWAPDPLMVGIRSPDGLVVGSCTSHPGVLGSFPKREEPGKTGAPCIKVPGSSRVPAPPWVGSRSPDGWDQIPRWAGGWACTSHPGVLGSIPKREEPGKTGAPCVKVPGSSRVQVRDEQTHPHRPRLVVSHSTCPPLSSSPHANSFVIGPAVIKHTPYPFVPGWNWVPVPSPVFGLYKDIKTFVCVRFF